MNLFSLFSRSQPLEQNASSLVPFMGSVDGPTRTSTAAMPTDTRREITSFTRQQLLRKSRWLYNNMGLIRRFVKGTARYSVGSGILPIPMTPNQEFNDSVIKYIGDWADSPLLCDVRGKQTFWRMQRSALHGMFRDGEAFFLKASGEEEVLSDGVTKILSVPQLQWLEAQSFGNLNSSMYGKDTEGFIDGVRCTPVGRVTEYRMLLDSSATAMDLSATRRISRNDVIHLYDHERASQIRGLPWLYHGENSALDILDLTALEKHATKLHAALAAAIKKRTAEAGKGGLTNDLRKRQGTDAQGKSRVIAFENFFGGAGILQLGLDEEFQLLTSSRPSMTFSGFLDYLIRDIAWGFGVSPEFIWSVAGLGGPNLRFILEDAKWFFEDIQDMVVTYFIIPVYMWVLARGIERKELIVPADVLDPYEAVFQGPAKITVDQGKEGNLELERLKNGCGTWDEFWAARGKTGKQMIRKRIDELADAIEYAKEKNVPFDYVIALNKGGDGGPSEKKDPNKAGFVKTKDDPDEPSGDPEDPDSED